MQTRSSRGHFDATIDFVQNNEDRATATLMAREAHGDATALGPLFNAASTMSRAEEARDTEIILQKGMMGDVGVGLFSNIHFNDCFI